MPTRNITMVVCGGVVALPANPGAREISVNLPKTSEPLLISTTPIAETETDWVFSAQVPKTSYITRYDLILLGTNERFPTSKIYMRVDEPPVPAGNIQDFQPDFLLFYSKKAILKEGFIIMQITQV